MSKYTNDKDRANYLKNIGILNKSISMDELKEALFSTDMFNNVFVEVLIASLKSYFNFNDLRETGAS